MAIAESRNIPVFEDSAQALGGTFGGRYLGTIGKAGIYSLDIGKIITTGEGGLLVTNDENIYLRAREYSDHGHENNPNFPRGEDTRSSWGFNYKATEFHGAVGQAQLKKLDFILQKQKENKRKIKEQIRGLKGLEFREIPDEAGDASDTLIFFLETKEKALDFARHLKGQGIGTKNLPDAINWHFAGTWNHIFGNAVFPQSENLLRRAVAIPVMVNMPEEQIQKIVSAIKEASEKSCLLPNV